MVSFCENLETDSIQDILPTPVWYNTKLIHAQNSYYKNWYEKVVRQISDIIGENGNLYQFNKFKVVYGGRIPFLDYHILISKIPMEWKIKINDNKVYSILNRFNVNCNYYVQLLLKDKKDVGDVMIY